MMKMIIDGVLIDAAHDMHLDFHGHSVFTTLRSQASKPLLWERHWQRLSLHAQFFGYSLPKEASVYQLIEQELENQSLDQKIRIVIASDRSLITLEPCSTAAFDIYSGVTIHISDITVHPQLAPYKTGNSLPYALAYRAAQKVQAFEGLLLDQEGHVVDGSRTSLMLYDGHCLLALDGGLKGCMREEALAFAERQGVKVAWGQRTASKLSGQLLLANSIMGVLPVGPIRFDVVRCLVDRFRFN